MKKFIFLLLIFYSFSGYSQLPNWLTLPNSEIPDSIITNAPLTKLELVNLIIPKKLDYLIGSEIHIETSSNIWLNFYDFNDLMEIYLIRNYYKDSESRILELNQERKTYNGEMTRIDYKIGYTNESFSIGIPYSYYFKWKDKFNAEQLATITIQVIHYYSNPFIYPQIEIQSKSKESLRKGTVEFERIGPGSINGLKEVYEIEDGKVVHSHPLPAGHYSLELIEPEECASILNDNLVILPDDVDNDEKFKFIKSCQKTYDIYATYDAPGFAHVELVWENAEIRFPNEGDEIQFFDRTAYIQSGGNGENPTGTDGKPLHIPFAMNVPGVGKITNYGAPENNIPRVISIYSLGAYEGKAQFKLRKIEESLNMCEMTQKNDRAVYLDLQFDLFAGGDKDPYAIQHTVHCIEDNIIINRDKASIINQSPYPTAFEQLTITDADIENFKNFRDFEKTLSNGRATLKIEFKIVKN